MTSARYYRFHSWLRSTGTLCSLFLLCGAACAFDVQGHRGTRGNRPENTLPAFERALQIGVDTLELDVAVTADGVVVVSHDPFLNPDIARDASGQWLTAKGPLIHSLTLAQLQAYDVGRIKPGTAYATTFASQQPVDGTRIPTLAALFARVKALGASTVRFNIETKLNPLEPETTVAPEAMVQALLKVVRDAGMAGRVSIQSFDWRSLKLVREAEPAIPTVCLTVRTANTDNTADPRWTAGLRIADHGGSVPRLVKAAGCAAWSPNAGTLLEPQVKEAQGLGLQVIPWTVNNAADIERLVGWKVDGIISDYPERVREVLERRTPPQR